MTKRKPQGLCLDKGYDYDEVRNIAEESRFTAHIRTRGEEAKAIKRRAGHRARRWVVERTHLWLNRFRRILVRWKKLLESYALDAIDWYDSDKEQKALKSEVTKFRKATLLASAESHPAVGLGTDFRLESKKVTGFALALNEQILHMSIFAREDDRKKSGDRSRMRRFSQRRINR